MQLRPGAAKVIAALRDAGHYVAILTGGFDRGVEAALEAEGVDVDAIVANRLPVVDGKLTGEVEGPLISGTKDDALEVAAAITGEDRGETIAIGDGANDLPMLSVAGLAIGFEPKPAVEPTCDVVVSTMDELYDLLDERAVL